MMRKIGLIMLSLSIMVMGCRGEEPEVERPLYPTEGAINARYTIADQVTVVFAKGNLQYHPRSGMWRFAGHQYDVAGFDNELADTNYNGWIDLFGWGTSGENGLMPYTVTDSSGYYALGLFDIGGGEYDWGLHNAITNGGNSAGSWRTLTYDEWEYLLKYRTAANMKRGLATIEVPGVYGSAMHGMLLLPDKWELPEGCTFQYGTRDGFGTNVYTMEQWNRMEGAGAVFLPAAGERTGVRVSMVGDYGCYWSSTGYTLESAYELYFLSSGYQFYTTDRASGHSVRLVMER
ncbi:MAG: hypothetical protein IJK84_08865 [Bacteroidales bacterium]|nr:hypothetical protein [Bacteroidales bacterium]